MLRMFADNEEDLRAYIDLRKRARAAGAGIAAPPPPPPPESGKPCEFPLARRAAMRCAERAFQKFLGVETAEAAVDELRRRCNIASRKEFDRDAAARERWRAVDAEFGAWLRCADGDGDERG
ncbi:hypothetical protein [Methylocapsa aurea]|uniref:hypothetical protein n=1 Tax=Methylocapsa aurea TaxID=663610 RepID=UPI003D18C97A